MLKTVTIQNFKSLVNKTLVCDKNKTIIEGANMTGKTTVLDAIYWAVTGHTLDESANNNALIPLGSKEITTRVSLEFDNFTLVRGLYRDKASISTFVEIDGEIIPTLKKADAIINAKLGLTDASIISPKGFDIKAFLMNPLYFESVAPGTMRKFYYKMANIDLIEIYEKQKDPVKDAMARVKGVELDPYILLDTIASEQKENKKKIDALNIVMSLIPPTKKMESLVKSLLKKNTLLEADAALIKNYALDVNLYLNNTYNKYGLDIRLTEYNITTNVAKEVCYPTLANNLPYSLGSYAEKTLVATMLVTMFAHQYKLAPLPLLIDNMESLDEKSTKFLNNYIEGYSLQYIGAKVI